MADIKADAAPRLIVSAAPHLKTSDSVEKVMYSVVIAMLPALAGAVYYFGWRALWVTAIAVVTAVLTEAAVQKFRKVRITALDGSAVVVGMLLAFNLPPSVPWWMPVAGTFFAVAIGKHAFGGLGMNPMNPALLGRAFLMASWPVYMTTGWSVPQAGTAEGVVAVTGATPLATVKAAMADLAAGVNVEQSRLIIDSVNTTETYLSLFFGSIGGCIGETSVLLLLIGAAYLFYKQYINYRIPLSFIGTVAVLAWVFGGEGYFTGDFLFHVLTGGLVIGAFFMATDMVTCPSTPWGQLVFGMGCGLLTVFIRLVGGYPEGVCYSILLMNLATPFLDRYTKPKIFGA
ncbi:MAG: RnfABCDGE type electron transport complex subunit D [Syntrophobacterales bacterium]|jgi:electron transport complex protein RnfD|nr:RnfABCDGE type electron transport complex subunit D [Syntrophobacterales bacterium]